MYNAFVFDKCVLIIPQVCHATFICLYGVSKPTKLRLFREVKDGDVGEFKRLVKSSRHHEQLQITLS